MKKVIINKTFAQIIFKCFLILLLIAQCLIAKSKPILLADRQLAFKRANSLDNGISVSWLEQTWVNDVLNNGALTDADFKLFKALGFRSLRLPVAFVFFESKKIPLTDVLIRIDEIIKQCHLYGIKLIIDYHYQ